MGAHDGANVVTNVTSTTACSKQHVPEVHLTLNSRDCAASCRFSSDVLVMLPVVGASSSMKLSYRDAQMHQ